MIFRYHQPKLLICHILCGIIVFQRVQQIGPQDNVKKTLCGFAFQCKISFLYIGTGKTVLFCQHLKLIKKPLF